MKYTDNQQRNALEIGKFEVSRIHNMYEDENEEFQREQAKIALDKAMQNNVVWQHFDQETEEWVDFDRRNTLALEISHVLGYTEDVEIRPFDRHVKSQAVNMRFMVVWDENFLPEQTTVWYGSEGYSQVNDSEGTSLMYGIPVRRIE